MLPSSQAGSFALAVGLVLASLGSVAAHPLHQDDAGSGRDAGDGRESAVALGEGRHEGRLGAGDLMDVYALEADRFDVIDLSVDAPAGTSWLLYTPSGFMFVGGAAPAQKTVALNETGTWYLSLRVPHVAGESAYVLTWGKSRFAMNSVIAADGAWLAAERAWDVPDRLFLQIVVHLPAKDLFETQAFQGRIEVTTRGAPGGRDAHVLIGFGEYAGGVASRAAVRIDSPAGPVDAAVQWDGVSTLDAAGVGTAVIQVSGLSGVIGSARMHGYTDFGTPFEFFVLHDAPHVTAVRSGSDLHVWRYGDPSGSPHVSGPSVFVAGPREFVLDAKEPFSVWGDLMNGGWYEDPSGARHAPRAGGLLSPSSFSIRDGAPGRWTFHSDGGWSLAEYYNLIGAPSPSLGLHVPWRP